MVKIDKDKCIGCGTCVSICPEVFEIDSKDNKAKVKSGKKALCIKDAINSCPVGAISE
jgi:ferredoxin